MPEAAGCQKVERIDSAYMKTAGEIMRHGDPNVPDELIYITTGDFTGAPMAHSFYGGDEVLGGMVIGLEFAPIVGLLVML